MLLRGVSLPKKSSTTKKKTSTTKKTSVGVSSRPKPKATSSSRAASRPKPKPKPKARSIATPKPSTLILPREERKVLKQIQSAKKKTVKTSTTKKTSGKPAPKPKPSPSRKSVKAATKKAKSKPKRTAVTKTTRKTTAKKTPTLAEEISIVKRAAKTTHKAKPKPAEKKVTVKKATSKPEATAQKKTVTTVKTVPKPSRPAPTLAEEKLALQKIVKSSKIEAKPSTRKKKVPSPKPKTAPKTTQKSQPKKKSSKQVATKKSTTVLPREEVKVIKEFKQAAKSIIKPSPPAETKKKRATKTAKAVPTLPKGDILNKIVGKPEKKSVSAKPKPKTTSKPKPASKKTPLTVLPREERKVLEKIISEAEKTRVLSPKAKLTTTKTNAKKTATAKKTQPKTKPTTKPSLPALPKEEQKVLKQIIGEVEKSAVLLPSKVIVETRPKTTSKPKPKAKPKPSSKSTTKLIETEQLQQILPLPKEVILEKIERMEKKSEAEQAAPTRLELKHVREKKEIKKREERTRKTVPTLAEEKEALREALKQIQKEASKSKRKSTEFEAKTTTEIQPVGEGLLIAKTKKEALKAAAQVPGSQIHKHKSVWVVTRPGTTYSKKNIQQEFQIKDVTESYAEQKHYAELGWELYATQAGTFAIPPGITEQSRKRVKQQLRELPARELFTGYLVEIEYPSGTKSYKWFRTEEKAEEWLERQRERQEREQKMQELKQKVLETHENVKKATQGVEQLVQQVQQTINRIIGGEAASTVSGGIGENLPATTTVTSTKEAEKLIHKEAEKAKREFEQQLKQEEKRARQEFEQKLREEAEYYRRLDVPESQIQTWIKKNRKRFEKNISEWRQEQKSQFQQQLKSWEQEQLSNIKTQLYTKPSSDLWKTSILAGFLLGIERQFWESTSPTSQKKDLLEATPPSLLPGKVKKEIMRTPMAEGLLSGITGQFEAAAYGVASAFGFKPPPPPPTIFEPERLRKAGPGYTAGAGVGTVLGLLIGTKAVGSLSASGAWTVVKTGAIGAAADVGLTQTIKFASGEGWLTPKEAAQSAFLGASLSIANIGAFAGAARFAPKLVASRAGRVVLQTGFGGLAGYILSKGDVETALKTAAFSGLLTAGIEYVGIPLFHEARVRFGRATRLREAGVTLGAGGEEVPVWESPSLEELGGKRIRVVGSVTERPVGTGGVTTESLIKEYVGKKVPASHATLDLSAFKGESVLLRGFPEEARGWRKAAGMFHFYTAPGGEDFVNIYGGYMGIGAGYSRSPPKVRFGGKPGVVVARETYVSPELLPQPGESISEYLSRFSFASGQTGISPETVLGFSAERQLSTPASYARFGVKLPGTLFRPEKVLSKAFQIKQVPSGILGKIPILRTLLSRYTEFGVVVGKFAPATETLSISKNLFAGLGSLPTAEMSSIPTVTVSPPFTAVPLQVISPPVSRTNLSSLLKISTPRFDVSSLVSEVSAPSILSDLKQPSLSLQPLSTSKPTVSPLLTVSDLVSQLAKTLPKTKKEKAPSTKKKMVSKPPSQPSKPSTPRFPSTTILDVSVPSLKYEKQPSIPSISILDVSVPSVKHEKKPSAPSVLSSMLEPSPLVSPPSKPSRSAYPLISKFKPSISKMKPPSLASPPFKLPKPPSTPKIKISRPPSKISPPILSPPKTTVPKIPKEKSPAKPPKYPFRIPYYLLGEPRRRGRRTRLSLEERRWVIRNPIPSPERLLKRFLGSSRPRGKAKNPFAIPPPKKSKGRKRGKKRGKSFLDILI